MIPIRKNLPPNSLSRYSRAQHASFENMPSNAKNELRQSLLAEQKGICCYCMSRTDLQESRIEHWESQANFPAKQLDYDNMMLACHGNEGEPPNKQHCDVRKGDSLLKFNPSNREHTPRLTIRYLSDGSIESEDTDFNKQLNNVLNLNLAVLKRNRKEVCDAVIKVLTKKGWNRGSIGEQIKKYQPLSQGQMEPFCGVALYHLEKWLRKYR